MKTQDSISHMFPPSRLIYTPSPFARTSLLHLQEAGTLQAGAPHRSERSGMPSCLFFLVLSGGGRLCCEEGEYELREGDCVFLDCRKPYSHETGCAVRGEEAERSVPALWSLQWCHFYGPNMNAIYRKYRERGGKPVFHPEHPEAYRKILTELREIAGSADYVRDMRIQEKLSALLVLLMEDAWDAKRRTSAAAAALDIQQVKEYLDENFREKISLDGLAGRFFINKYYLLSLFKERFGMTVNAYLNQVRVTYVKEQLRFTDRTVEELAEELQIGPSWLSRLFRKVEGVSPAGFRKSWRGQPGGEDRGAQD